jgi:PAS domain S-box-containing protein
MRATYKGNVDKWGDIRVALVPFRDAKGRKYLFGSSVRMTEVERQLREVVWQAFAVGLIGFMFSTAVGLWVARRVTSPISRLTDTIRAIAAGRSDLKAEESGSVEMVTLARHFNLMHRFLQGRISDLETSHSQLVTRHDTELRHAAGSLKMSEQRYYSLLNFAVDGILVGRPDGVIAEANERMCELFGLARSEIVGKHISEMPFTAECLKAAPFRFDLLAKGEKIVTERTIRRKDGSELIVGMHSKMMPDGTLQSIYRDITERKKTEAALSEMRRLLEDTQRIAQMGGWEIDFTAGKAAWTDEIYRIYGVGRDFDISDVEKVFSFYDAES